MASSTLEVWNIAMTNLGIGTEIASITERSQEAQACNRVSDIAIDEVLRSWGWPFCKKNVALALVTSKGDTGHPTTEYLYSYRYPSDCLQARKILSEVRNDSRASRWTYEEMADEQGTLIVTDKQYAVLEYTSNVGRNPGRWSADFVTALAYLISSRVAPRLTKGDPYKLGNANLGLYARSIAIARSNAANEIQPDEAPESDSILVRF